jgi:hypothetical protein
MGVRRTVALCALGLVAAGCGGSGTGAVERYEGGARDRVDKLAEAGDCRRLRAELDRANRDARKLTPLDESETSDLADYIERRARDVGCDML